MANSTPQSGTLGRPCLVCAGPREAIESAVLEGDTLSDISATYGMARSSLRRHVQSHMSVDPGAAKEAGLDPISIAARVLDVAERARMLADDALDDGHVQSAVRAGDAEIRALGALASMWVRHEDALVEAVAYRAVVRAVARVARQDPQVANAIAAELTNADQLALARELRDAFTPKEIES